MKKGAWELYDIQNDRTELNDLAAENQKRLTEMIRAYDQWAQRVGVVDWKELEGKKE
jgi:arylsulfatase